MSDESVPLEGDHIDTQLQAVSVVALDGDAVLAPACDPDVQDAHLEEAVPPRPFDGDAVSAQAHATPVRDASALLRPTAHKTSPGRNDSRTAYERRLEVFYNYACTTGPWFAVSMVPRRTEWEVVYHNRLLTALSYLDKPLTIWIVGKLRSLALYIGVDLLNPTLRLALDLTRKIDIEALADIERVVHRSYENPASTTFRAIVPGGFIGHEIFHELYDASTSYKAKGFMKRLQISDFRCGDTVLAECWFVRKELTGGWQTAFHLKSMSRIAGDHANESDNDPIGHDDSVPFPWEI